jgi:hypothetical protein
MGNKKERVTFECGEEVELRVRRGLGDWVRRLIVPVIAGLILLWLTMQPETHELLQSLRPLAAEFIERIRAFFSAASERLWAGR